jgi:hypothetical protein
MSCGRLLNVGTTTSTAGGLNASDMLGGYGTDAPLCVA